jgi:hypothetical protein
MTLVLSRSDLERLLEPRVVIDALCDAFRRHAFGVTIVPPRSVLLISGESRRSLRCTA